jgi:hypothetical protein
MMSANEPTITIAHEIPGRIRYRLSHLLTDANAVSGRVRGHLGIREVAYTAVTRSFVVTFDSALVNGKELTVRLGMAYSLDQDLKPVKLFSSAIKEEMSPFAMFAGAALLVSLAARIRSRTGVPALEFGAGMITAMASLEHGYQEVQERGEFDPEVLSVVYLVTAFFRGNLLPASIVTWLATFGRHLVSQSGPGVEIKAVRLNPDSATEPEYEVVVSPTSAQTGWQRVLRVLPKVLHTVLGGGEPGRRGSLLGDIERMSLMHGEVIDGLGEWRQGIPVRIR